MPKAHGAMEVQIAPLFVLLFATALFQQLYEQGRAAITGIAGFALVELDANVVDAHAGHCGKQVLDRVHFRVPRAQNGAAALMRVVHGVLGRDQNFRMVGKIGADEPNAGPGRGGTKPRVTAFTGVNAHAFIGDVAGESCLPLFHSTRSRSRSSSRTRSSRTLSCS